MRFKWIEWNLQKIDAHSLSPAEVKSAFDRERQRLMSTPETDQRTASRKAKDEQIAAEPRLAAPQLPPDAAFAPVEAHLAHKPRRPLAVVGVVENGLVRPL